MGDLMGSVLGLMGSGGRCWVSWAPGVGAGSLVGSVLGLMGSGGRCWALWGLGVGARSLMGSVLLVCIMCGVFAWEFG